VLEPNTVYIAPGGKQMKVATGVGGKKVVRITDDPPENNCKPAADYLFRSVAKEYRDRATGVIMTGMGQDGTLGLKVMKSFGAVVIAQDAESCVVYGMPKAAVEAGVVDIVVPLDKIAQEIVNTVRR
jgi:two-component system chemotaxis response regulator CheB